MPHHCCPSCGASLQAVDEEQQTRIADLEAQVRILSDKATQAADKLADYEDELHSIKQVRSQTPTPNTSRFSSLLNLRRAPPSPPLDYESAEYERKLRLETEAKLNTMTSELEELSASLFQQANEMVADERRARGRLEERVKVLEEREKKNGARLEDLERAVERIERVRGILGKPLTAD